MLYPIEGEVVQARGAWSKRRANALNKQADTKDSYFVNAVRGAHIAVTRCEHALIGAVGAERAAAADMLANAKARLAAATETLAKYMSGEAEAPAAPSEPEPVTQEPESPADPGESTGETAPAPDAGQANGQNRRDKNRR